jgi:hypothetical protein
MNITNLGKFEPLATATSTVRQILTDASGGPAPSIFVVKEWDIVCLVFIIALEEASKSIFRAEGEIPTHLHDVTISLFPNQTLWV